MRKILLLLFAFSNTAILNAQSIEIGLPVDSKLVDGSCHLAGDFYYCSKPYHKDITTQGYYKLDSAFNILSESGYDHSPEANYPLAEIAFGNSYYRIATKYDKANHKYDFSAINADDVNKEHFFLSVDYDPKKDGVNMMYTNFLCSPDGQKFYLFWRDARVLPELIYKVYEFDTAFKLTAEHSIDLGTNKAGYYKFDRRLIDKSGNIILLQKFYKGQLHYARYSTKNKSLVQGDLQIPENYVFHNEAVYSEDDNCIYYAFKNESIKPDDVTNADMDRELARVCRFDFSTGKISETSIKASAEDITAMEEKGSQPKLQKKFWVKWIDLCPLADGKIMVGLTMESPVVMTVNGSAPTYINNIIMRQFDAGMKQVSAVNLIKRFIVVENANEFGKAVTSDFSSYDFYYSKDKYYIVAFTKNQQQLACYVIDRKGKIATYTKDDFNKEEPYFNLSPNAFIKNDRILASTYNRKAKKTELRYITLK